MDWEQATKQLLRHLHLHHACFPSSTILHASLSIFNNITRQSPLSKMTCFLTWTASGEQEVLRSDRGRLIALTTGGVDGVSQLSVLPLAQVVLLYPGCHLVGLRLHTPEIAQRRNILEFFLASYFSISKGSDFSPKLLLPAAYHSLSHRTVRWLNGLLLMWRYILSETCSDLEIAQIMPNEHLTKQIRCSLGG